MSQSQEVIYSLFHWWKGDKYSDPGWVCTGSYLTKASMIEALENSRRLGFDSHRAIKTIKEFCRLPGEEDDRNRNCPATEL